MSTCSFENKKINPSKSFVFSFCCRRNENHYTIQILLRIDECAASRRLHLFGFCIAIPAIFLVSIAICTMYSTLKLGVRG